jgi:hypothetical protein
MSASEFVDPQVARLPLASSNGRERWIDVKQELNAGETRRVFAKLVKTMHAGGGEKVQTELDPEQVGLTKIVEYLVGWSFTDSAGKAIPVSASAINNLRPPVYKEIVEAIDAHEERTQAEAEAAKHKDPTGATES